MSVDVRIDPEASTATIAGRAVRLSALRLGGVPRGAAVVVTGPDGLGSVESVDVMNALAEHGYESVLAEPTDPWPDDSFAAQLVRRLVDRVAARGWTHEQVGLIGYGQGARAVLVASARATFGAAISIPRDARQLVTPDRITTLRTPWLGMAGLGAHSELTGELSTYRDEVTDRSTEHTTFVGYPGVAHCLHDSTEALVHAAVFDSWQRTAEWLDTHVAPRPTPLAEAWRRRQKSTQLAAS